MLKVDLWVTCGSPMVTHQLCHDPKCHQISFPVTDVTVLHGQCGPQWAACLCYPPQFPFLKWHFWGQVTSSTRRVWDGKNMSVNCQILNLGGLDMPGNAPHNMLQPSLNVSFWGSNSLYGVPWFRSNKGPARCWGAAHRCCRPSGWHESHRLRVRKTFGPPWTHKCPSFPARLNNIGRRLEWRSPIVRHFSKINQDPEIEGGGPLLRFFSQTNVFQEEKIGPKKKVLYLHTFPSQPMPQANWEQQQQPQPQKDFYAISIGSVWDF